MRTGAGISVLLLAAAGVAACSSGNAQEPGNAETLTVFAAASLQEAFDDLLDEFAEDHPEIEVHPAVYDGSSTLVLQIAEGAHADVLATADEPTMDEALDAGISTSEPRIFASNRLVLAVPIGNPLSIEALSDVQGITYAACAEQVPCGRATSQAFAAVQEPLAPTTVEQNVTAVANRISQGEVDAGFIYESDVAARPELEGLTPEGMQVVNFYPITQTSQVSSGADFIEFVTSERGQEILTEYGFGSAP